MKQTIVLLIICIPLLLNAQDDKGIKFEQGLTWQQIKDKAKKEKKYIFVDCFTTWCGPCKLMDREVYPNEEVGDYFKAHFISVKSQMDRSGKDNEQVKNWYNDAATIEKEYGIPAYPTYLFFTPKGKLMYRDEGYKRAEDLLALAKKMMTLGTTPPYQRYYALVQKYQQGNKDFSVMSGLIDTARKLGQNELLKNLLRDYMDYLKALPENKLYTQTNISFIASNIENSKSDFFHLFYPDGKKTDSIINNKGFAQRILYPIIYKEEIGPTIHLNEMQSSGTVKIVSEPDWQQIIKSIESKYPGVFADQLIVAAKIQWFYNQRDWSECAKWITIQTKKQYSMDENSHQMDLYLYASIEASILYRSTDKEQIDAGINSMKDMLKRVSERGYAPFVYLDTYAKLLYKADRKEDGIQWEEKAQMAAIDWHQNDIKKYDQTIEKMKKGEPTWAHYLDRTDIFSNY